MAPRSSVPPVDGLTRPSGGLTFLQPTTPEPASPSDAPSPSDLPSEPSSPSDPLDDSRSASAPLHDEPGDPSEDEPRSSTGSSTKAPSAASKRVLRDAIRESVLMAGAVAHDFLARDQAAQEAGLYLADEDDAESIGDPLANMANRRGGIGAAGNPDVADAISALIGLAFYATKQFKRARAARELRRAAAQTTGLATADAAAELHEPAGV